MAVEKRKISADQRDLILKMEEGHFADLKALEIAPAKLTKAIAALANADGGELFVGIDEDKVNAERLWRGFAKPEDANGHVQAFEPLFPLGNDFDYFFLECEGETGLVLQIQVRKTADIKRASDGTVYIRRGAQNLPVATPAALRQREYKALDGVRAGFADAALSGAWRRPVRVAAPWARRRGTCSVLLRQGPTRDHPACLHQEDAGNPSP